MEYYTTGTWQHGFGRVLEGLTMFDAYASEDFDHEPSRFCPFDKISYTQAEAVGGLLRILDGLRDDLAPIERGDYRTISEWTTTLKRLHEAHFSAGDDESDAEGERTLRGCIDELQKAAHRIETRKFPASTVVHHLEKILEKRGNQRTATNLQSVRFCSIGSLGPLPLEIIIVMGMVDGAYPTSDRAPSFHLMHMGRWSEELHARIDIERYQFLECLLSARSQLIITYPSQCGGDTNEHPPSSLVNDVFHYLDSACIIAGEKPSKTCLRRHPLLPFHYSYFSEDGKIKNYSQQHFNAAMAFYHQERKKQPSFLSSFAQSKNTVPEPLSALPLADLITFAKHPMRSFLNKTLGIYLPWKNGKEKPDEDAIMCTTYDKTVLTRRSLKYSPESVLAHAERSGLLPNSPFKHIETANINEESAKITQQLAAKGIAFDDMLAIEFNEKFSDVVQEGSVWRIPPLLIEIPGYGDVKITGRIDHIHPTGLLFLIEDQLKKAVEVWPQILVYCCLIDSYGLGLGKNVYFAKKGKVGEKSAQETRSKRTPPKVLNILSGCKTSPSPDLAPMGLPSPQWQIRDHRQRYSHRQRLFQKNRRISKLAQWPLLGSQLVRYCSGMERDGPPSFRQPCPQMVSS